MAGLNEAQQQFSRPRVCLHGSERISSEAQNSSKGHRERRTLNEAWRNCACSVACVGGRNCHTFKGLFITSTVMILALNILSSVISEGASALFFFF